MISSEHPQELQLSTNTLLNNLITAYWGTFLGCDCSNRLQADEKR